MAGISKAQQLGKKKGQLSIKKLKYILELCVKQYVRERDDYTSQKTGKRNESDVQVSHVIPESAGDGFAFDPINLMVLDYHSHLNWWHKNPIEAAEWFKEKFPDRYIYLFVDHNANDRLRRWKSWEVELEIAKYPKQLEFVKMKYKEKWIKNYISATDKYIGGTDWKIIIPPGGDGMPYSN